MKRAFLKMGVFVVLSILSSRGEETDSPAHSPLGLKFTLKEAELYALQNHPEIASANLTADAIRQQIREARSAFFPQVNFQSPHL